MCDIWHKSHWHCWSLVHVDGKNKGPLVAAISWFFGLEWCDANRIGRHYHSNSELSKIYHIIESYYTTLSNLIHIFYRYYMILSTCCCQDYPKQRIDQNASFAQAKILWTTIRYNKFASNQGQPKSPLKPVAFVWSFDVCMTGSDNHLALSGWWFV